MTSNDNRQYLTVEMFNSATGNIDKRLDIIDSRFVSLDKTLTIIGYELRYNARDTEHLQTSVYWCFALLGIIIAVVGLFAPLLLEFFRESRSNKKHEDMRDIAREVMHEEVSEAVRRFLGGKQA